MKYFSARGAMMKRTLLFFVFVAGIGAANAQIQVLLKFTRLQYLAYEPLIATVSITNRAGRDIELHDDGGQQWFGFEITRDAGESIGPSGSESLEPLKIGASQTVTRKINLTLLYPVQEFGAYHVRAHVYFGDLGRYYYSQTKVVQVTGARPIWKQSVGIPENAGVTGDARTYSLMSNRFPEHTSLYVRVEDEARGVVYATYSLGRVIAFDEPHAEIDRSNNLHVLQCSAPRTWSYATIGLNGQLLAHSTLVETKSRPHFKRNPNGDIAVVGGMTETAVNQELQNALPKLSTRPVEKPAGN